MTVDGIDIGEEPSILLGEEDEGVQVQSAGGL